jgi:hypothetical protein
MKEMKGKSNFTKNYKIKKFKLSDEEQALLKAKVEDLKSMVTQELETNIKKLSDRVEELSKSKSGADNSSTKKNIVLKLRKFKKELKDEALLKKRVDMLKLKWRKLNALHGRVEVKLDKLKLLKVRCFKCRRRGHSVANCRYDDRVEDDGEGEGEGECEGEAEGEIEQTVVTKKPQPIAKKVMCYNCGASDHGLYACQKPVDHKNLPFAECFICKGKGHISANCPQSENGIYPRGGTCFVCNQKDHLAKYCPQKQIQQAQTKEKPKNKINDIDNGEKTMLKKKRAADKPKIFKNKPRIKK